MGSSWECVEGSVAGSGGGGESGGGGGGDGGGKREQNRKPAKRKKFSCEACAVRLPLLSPSSVEEHMSSAEHKAMETLLKAQLWPGPMADGENNRHQTKPIIFYNDLARKCLYCRLCKASLPSALELLRHQSSLPHLKQMIRNALFAHSVLFFCEPCGNAVSPLSVSKVTDHLRSRVHAAAVGGRDWEEPMCELKSADAFFASIFDWGITELVSVNSVESVLSAEEFGVLEVGRKDAWDLPKDGTSQSPAIAVDMAYWEHRLSAADCEAARAEAEKKLTQAKGRKVLSHCVDVLRYALRCFPTTQKQKVLVYDPAFFKIYLLGRLTPPAFAILHKLLTQRLPTRQEGPDLVRFSAKDFVPRSSVGVRASPSPSTPSTSSLSDAENALPWARIPPQAAKKAKVEAEAEDRQSIPPSPPSQSPSQPAPPLPGQGNKPSLLPNPPQPSPNSICSLWLNQ